MKNLDLELKFDPNHSEMGGAESKEFKPTPSGRSPGRNPLQNLIRSFKKSPRPRKKSKDSQKSKKSTDVSCLFSDSSKKCDFFSELVS